MDIRLRMIGLVRFSVLSTNYYSERFNSLEEKAAHLFSPERMDLRFRLFEHLCLRSLTQQSDPSFRLIVLTSEDLPDPYLERLLELTEPYSNIFCHGAAPDTHYQQLKGAFSLVNLRRATHHVLFRLDDDDALDRNFVKRTKGFARGMIPLQGEGQTPFIIAHNRGLYLEKTAKGAELYDTCERSPLSTGLSLVAPADHPANPYAFNHRKIAQHYNTFSDISVPAFLRTIHGDNKSDPAQMGLTRKWPAHQIQDALNEHFGYTAAQLKALLP
ncbi:glycosyltransferase [Leisingera sp. F5]|uniref:glycosyltransferase n=1 Tax=Leisingera sp. F5 TaxID=1813816 RepID=UPI000A51EE79|nr:glycosyltransferase [Leisingera sp. F5]